MAKRSLVAMVTVGVFVTLFAVCIISAIQELEPRGMPFGVTGPSPVIEAVQSKYSLELITYADQAALTDGAERGDIYGGYIPGSTSDTLVTVPAKSFFGEVYISDAFGTAAKGAGRSFTTTVIAPLPTSDRTGAVSGLLLLPTLLGAYLLASLLFSATHTAAASGRIAIVAVVSVVVAILTGIIAGPILGAIPNDSLLLLLPCFALVTAAVGLAAIAIQGLLGGLGTLVMAFLFIVLGGAGSGGAGVALLPTYWQFIGALFPPRYAIELYRNVLYFGSNNIVLPIAVLVAYAVVGIAVILLVQRRREAPDSDSQMPDDPAGKPQSHRLVPKQLLAPVLFAVALSALFGLNYTSSGHSPVAVDMPFGVVGSTQLVDAAQGPLFDLDVQEYPDQSAATAAMDAGEIYGALVTDGTSSELFVVPTISDIAPLDIAANFEAAAERSGATITVTPYAPTPLAPKDPFAMVPAALLVPLLVAGYMAAALLVTATGVASVRWRGVWLAGFAIVLGLVIDLLVTYGLEGLPSSSFLIVWPILSLIVLVVALIAAVLRRVLGPSGILVTVIVVLQFGNPSSGGANGAPYLPPFWDAIGPLLPPRNAFILLRNTVYFGGNGIAQALAVLLIYAGIAAAILMFLDWKRSPEPGDQIIASQDVAVAAAAAPVGVIP